jgi:hypothetical protein
MSRSAALVATKTDAGINPSGGLTYYKGLL